MLYNMVRVAARLVIHRFTRPKVFSGSSDTIAHTILNELWSGDYYRTGLGHFTYFWCRDFGSVAEALVRLGYKEEVIRTARWALSQYMKAGRVTTCISSDGIPFNAPRKAIDSLPWLLHILYVTNMPLQETERAFLRTEVEQFCEAYLDTTSGTMLPNINCAELRDAAHYNKSAYAITMLAVLARYTSHFSISHPLLEQCDHAQMLKEHYWNGSYFKADQDTNAFSVECNLFPFFLNIVEDTDMLHAVLKTISDKSLTNPYPIKYTDVPHAFRYTWWNYVVMPHYQSETIWTWHGLIYIHLLQRVNSPLLHTELHKMHQLIVRHHTLPELLNPDGSWYETPLYQSGEGMLWTALYMDIRKKSTPAVH